MFSLPITKDMVVLEKAPQIIFVISILAAIACQSQVAWKFVGLYLLFWLFTVLLKIICNSFGQQFAQRPVGSGSTSIACGGLGGFPSSHTQAVVFTALFWTLYTWRAYRQRAPNTSFLVLSLLLTAGLWTFAVLVARQRIQSGCHSLPQVSAGAVIGLVGASISYFLVSTMPTR